MSVGWLVLVVIWVVAVATVGVVQVGARATRRCVGEPSTPRAERDRVVRVAPWIGTVAAAVVALLMSYAAPFWTPLYVVLLFLPAGALFSMLAGMALVVPGSWRRRHADH